MPHVSDKQHLETDGTNYIHVQRTLQQSPKLKNKNKNLSLIIKDMKLNCEKCSLNQKEGKLDTKNK